MGINDKSILEILDKLNSGQIMLEQAAKTMRKKLKRISGVDDVLKMVVDKKISTEEGLTLLNALTEGEKKESTTHGAIRKRSKGVAVFGFLIILFSIIATLMSCVPVIHSLCVSSEPRVFRFPPLFISCILLFFITLFNISWFICGINILRLREWARRSILGLSIFQLILIVPIALSQMLIMTTAVISSSTGGFLTLSTPRVMLGIIPMLFNIIWPILVLIFFTKSEVKKQFDAFPRLSSSGQPAEAVGRLYRSESSKVIAGVCGGFGEHFSKDPIVFRLVLVGLSLITGIIPGVIFYIICWVVMPQKDKVVKQVI